MNFAGLSARRRSWLAVAAAFVVALSLLLLRQALVDDPLERLSKRASDELPGAHEYQGQWHFPRGGPYVLGFESEGEARLHVDGRLVARGQGGVEVERVVFQAGNHDVRLVAQGKTRLLWHPPGRRGPPEYVPASSLRASDSESFSRPGTSLIDGCISLGILLIGLAALAYWHREKLRVCSRRQWLLVLGVFAVALGVRLLGLNAAGQTWDEDVNWSAGRNYITNLLAFDLRESSWQWNFEHPPVMKYLAGIGAQFVDGYTASRAISAVLGAASCVLVFLSARRMYSERVGVIAGLLCALTPHLIAHAKVVGHEAPTLFWWSLAIWMSLRASDDQGDAGRLARRMLGLGVVLGLAIASRYINGLLAPLVGLILLLQSPPEARKRVVALAGVILPFVAIATFVAVWPRLWSDPLAHLAESWDKLKKPHGAEAYLGHMTNAPPRSYFFVYLAATAPLGLLLGAVLGVGRSLLQRRRAGLIVAAWLLLPMIVSFSPVRQDGVRYILPSLLAVNILAALGVDLLLSELERRKAHRAFVYAPALVLVAYLLVVVVRIHPFYLDYYGEQVGGPAKVAAQKRFEVAWWGEGMNQALDYLNRHAAQGARVYKRCFEPGHLAWMRGDLWPREAQRPQDAEWFLVYQPHIHRCPVPSDAELVFETRAQGAILAQVFRRR